ncbi:AMP deaminase [Allomyces arbusculus]|nr:AMP deaminase [Allomyces arbusculus]
MSFEGAEKLLEIWFHAKDPNHATTASILLPDDPNPSYNPDESGVALAENGTDSGFFEIDHDVDANHQLGTPALSENGDHDYERTGLRAIDRDTWQSMLDVVNCKILSVIANEHADAYLLSESSLFVYPTHLILKTCGTTTLLLALPKIMQLASKHAGFTKVDKIFYSRKCFQFPEKQLWPHYSWDQEVDILDGMFANGAAYVLGRTNADHWYLWVCGTQPIPTTVQAICPDAQALVIAADSHANLAALTAHGTDPPDLVRAIAGAAAPPGGGAVAAAEEGEVRGRSQHPIAACMAAAARSLASPGPSRDGSVSPTWDDDGKVDTRSVHLADNSPAAHGCTLELLMTGLDAAQMDKYFYATSNLGNGSDNQVDAVTGLGDLWPGQQADSYLFEPCGWSQNTLNGAQYGTFHVTPEPSCSYASYETNVAWDQLAEVAPKVLDVFRPAHVTVTHFAATHALPTAELLAAIPPLAPLPGYKLVDMSMQWLPEHRLVYAHYVRADATVASSSRARKSRVAKLRTKEARARPYPVVGGAKIE